MNNKLAYELTENGLVPDSIVRRGIRSLLKQRLRDIESFDIELSGERQQDFIKHMAEAPIALLPHKANEQHYEIPQEFYEFVLGTHRKYSCCYWDDTVSTLDEAEEVGLAETVKHADLQDGMDFLELGCGWGSLSLYMAKHFPNSRITAVSNSQSQGDYIRRTASSRKLDNIEVITADMNDFEIDGSFDRVVSVEMFEHMRNHARMFERVAGWLKPEGRFFMHIFVHKSTPYPYEDQDESDWMTRYFFSGGMMPSDDLPLFHQDHLKIARRWRWSGVHYQRTSDAWLENMDNQRDIVWPILENTYGKDFAKAWFMRWRMFFLAVSELFGYDNGNEWYVSHYLFDKR